MTNQEIADKLAEVMGWVPSPGNSGWVDEANPRFFTARQAWHPTTDLNQAVQAAEKFVTWQLHKRGFGHGWYALVCTEHGAEDSVSTIGPADALSRAVVKAVGGDDA